MNEVTKRKPCTACGKPDWCAWSEKGERLRCMRPAASKPPESMREISRDGVSVTYGFLDWKPDHPTPSKGSTPKSTNAPSIDAAALHAEAVGRLTPKRLAALVAALGLPEHAVLRLVPGWCDAEHLRAMGASGSCWREKYPEGAWAFPERDSGGSIVGLSLRAPDGRKGSPKGGARGLTIPEGFDPKDGLVLLVEGASDVAAALALGYEAVGRPSNRGGVDAIAECLRGADVVVLAENDQKPDGNWPGRDGAVAVAGRLAARWGCPVRWAIPPRGVKDLRTLWHAHGAAGGSMLQPCIDAAEVIAPPERPTALPEPLPKDRISMVRASDVERREVDWLWHRRIPVGRITLLSGRPGCGKSFATCDWAARVSRGEQWPDGEPCSVGSVLFMCAEDDPGDTVVPRLMAHDADLDRIHLLQAKFRYDSEGNLRNHGVTLDDIPEIEDALGQVGDARMLVIDPIGSYLGGKADAHRDNEVRGLLAPLAAMASAYECAVILVAHTRKSAASFADDTVLGSRAFTGIARSVMHVMAAPENKDRKLLLPGKMNLCKAPAGLAYGITGSPPRIEWEPDPVLIDADALMATVVSGDGSGGKETSFAQNERGEAMEFLKDFLACGPKPAKVVTGEAADAGFTQSTIRRARVELGIKPTKTSEGHWEWALPEWDSQDAHGVEDAQPSKVLKSVEVSTLGNGEHLGVIDPASGVEVAQPPPTSEQDAQDAHLENMSTLAPSEHLGESCAVGLPFPKSPEDEFAVWRDP